MKHHTLNQQEPMTTEELIQNVAAEFATEYTDTDLAGLRDKSDEALKAHLAEVVAETLRFASILPGRPSRPTKPTV